MTSLIDYLAEPLGDEAGKAMCFLQGGRYNGDRGSVHAPAPELLAVTPCDGSCLGPIEGSAVPAIASCGMQTHWHDVARADELGDLPRHAAYYVLVDTRPAPSGMVAALYWSAGFERPAENEVRRAKADFERTVRQRAARAAAQTPKGE